MKCSEEIIRIIKMNVLDRVSKLPTNLIRKIKEHLDVDTYIELLLCENTKSKPLKKTIKNQYFETFIDDVNGTLDYILTNRIPTKLEKINEWTGDTWHFNWVHSLNIPEEFYYGIFKNNLYEPLKELVTIDKTLSRSVYYIGTNINGGVKVKTHKHPLLREIYNLISGYHLTPKPTTAHVRIVSRYKELLEKIIIKLNVKTTDPQSIVYILKNIRSFDKEFDNKLQNILLNYLKAMIVLTKPYCTDLIKKMLQERTEKDIQIDEDREEWINGIKKSLKENKMMSCEESYEKRRIEVIKSMEKKEARRVMMKARREMRKAEKKHQKAIAKEKERKKKLKAWKKQQEAKEAEKAAKKAAKEAEKAAKKAAKEAEKVAKEAEKAAEKRKAKLAVKAMKKGVAIERILKATLPSVKKLFK